MPACAKPGAGARAGGPVGQGDTLEQRMMVKMGHCSALKGNQAFVYVCLCGCVRVCAYRCTMPK